MIQFVVDDILESNAFCLVNTVNCEGRMGKGIAWQFKQKYPENEKYYISACQNGEMKIGKVLLFNEKNKLIANFPTKDKWREKSEYIFIEKGLDDLKEKILSNRIASIAIPPLGCGNGGLLWDKVKTIIWEKLDNLYSEITIYEPSKSFSNIKSSMPKITASHILLMRLKTRLTKFTKTRIQKACLFANVFNGDDYFKFEENKNRPYSHSIDIITRQIYEFQKIYNVSTNDAEKIALNNLISDSVLATINGHEISMLKASSFVNSITNDHDLELIGTLIYIIKKTPEISEKEIVEQFFLCPEEDIARFNENEIIKSLINLEKSKIIEKGLIGYSISTDMKNNSSMPRYKQ